MNIEAEILELKLRMEALQALACPGGVLKTTVLAFVAMIAEVRDARSEITQDLAALGIEIEGLRRQTNEHIISAQREMPAWYEALQDDLNELRHRLDRVLGEDTA
ncbi:hypothetical protein [Nonomuraea lactucae]|uniref:hypothetical protein n=1 Tax=Nonomuraea lactucae TaxID=2249762 RepID=UPI000DE1CEFE|nr:hypothetical protein [Nonomuraea lactucae]